MDPYSPGSLNLLIGEPYVMIFWVRFWIIFTEVGSIWAGYERHSRWIHGKPYLLSEEERRRQIYAKRERRGPLNPRTRGGEAGLSTAPTQSSAPTEQATMPTPQPLQIMLKANPEQPQP
ncbi:hypothetical protein Gotur_004767 [Gossypium turneri]